MLTSHHQVETFNQDSLREYCDLLSEKDLIFKKIIEDHGYPFFSLRKPGFEVLVRLILEQQVSLLSAKAAYIKLLEKIKIVSPENILLLTDEELRSCYFSRQKARYVKSLSQAVVEKKLSPHELSFLPDEIIKSDLIKITGIGQWTAESYLLLALNRLDIFPIGDIALVNSIKKIMNLPKEFPRDKMISLSERWKPYRSIATILFWHAYLIDKKIDVAKLDY